MAPYTSIYKCICSNPLKYESFQEKYLIQTIKELELNLELTLILSNQIKIDKEIFNQVVANFTVKKTQ